MGTTCVTFLLTGEGPNPLLQGADWNISMSAERQQGNWYQRRLFADAIEPLRPEAGGEGGTLSAACEESQPLTAMDQTRALTQHLMEEVTNRAN